MPEESPSKPPKKNLKKTSIKYRQQQGNMAAFANQHIQCTVNFHAVH